MISFRISPQGKYQAFNFAGKTIHEADTMDLLVENEGKRLQQQRDRHYDTIKQNNQAVASLFSPNDTVEIESQDDKITAAHVDRADQTRRGAQKAREALRKVRTGQ